MTTPATPVADTGARTEPKATLLSHLKREVKQIMEEAAVKRYIYEDGGSVTALCIAVEACLSHGLKRRIFGLFGTPSTFALLHKISPSFPPAAAIVKMVIQIEQTHFKTQKSEKRNESAPRSPPSTTNAIPFRNLWIRLSLFEKVLASIATHIGQHADKFYEPEALMRDPVAASTVSDLLAGPCALEYSKMKTLDHYWTDPPAEELLQRHRIHSRGGGALYATNPTASPKSPRPPLQVKRTESLGPDDLTQKVSACAREYVMLLHQNTKSSLLYGKNGVVVCPTSAARPMRGYLSLHQNADGTVTIKWTPNELMHSGPDPVQPCQIWRYALSIDVHEIVYLHYHQAETGGTIVLVGADGVQHPPIQFPTGQHPVAFLSCLENGIAPWGRLDPPLWSQRGKGKVLPRLRRRSSLSNGRVTEATNADQPDEYADLVFRLVMICRPKIDQQAARKPKNHFSFSFKERLLSLSRSPTTTPPTTPKSSSLQGSSSEQSPIRKYESHPPVACVEEENGLRTQAAEFQSQMSAPARLEESFDKQSRNILRTACDSMRYQILSRAFYGWLANCRHMKTIRTHLSGLVNETIASPDYPISAREGLTADEWTRLRADRSPSAELEFHRRVYFGNTPHELRRETWPVLLGLYPWDVDADGRSKIYESLRYKYEELLTEWTSVEAIVRERDREAFKAARGSDESRSTDPFEPAKQCSISSDVFLESEDEPDAARRQARIQSSGADGALVMDSLEDLSDVNVIGASQNVGSGLDSQTSTGIGTMDSFIGSPTRSTPEEGDGGLFSMQIIETFALNLHRIDKDVHRCDRHYPYFTAENLEKLKNVMCTYVWENLHVGYIQGMCDLAAVLLVVFDEEVLTYGCFVQQMKRMAINFPHGGGMDIHLANMRALLQIFDPELFELMQQNGDYTHFYFAYRWFLLDFKRELLYDDVFRVWETVWAASRVASADFILFLSMATIETYRDILLDNNMDFTDVIKFFNEMAEKHDAKALLDLARNLILRLRQALTA